jgi:tRNA threonylcarbamoyl adenosine modification protein YeaZ
VALARGEAGGATILARRSERIVRGHAERLMPMVDEVLAEAGSAYADLERIAVTTGPGSFTGVRVGVAAARALALALEIPAVGVGVLEALAAPMLRSEQAGTAAAALDAKRGQIYFRVTGMAAGNDAAMPGAAISVAEAAAILRSCPEPIRLSGSAASLLHDALPERQVTIAGTAESPDIAEVALLGLSAAPGAPPAPLYLRGADAKPQADKAVARL